MTLRSFLQLLRRWVVVIVVGVLVAAGAAVAAFMATPPSYTVKSQYLFLPAPLDDQGEPANPFLMVGNGMNILLDTISTSMMDGETVRSFVGESTQREYAVARDGSVAAPLILITVTDVDRASAYDLLARVGAETLDRSRALQEAAGAPRASLVAGSRLTTSVKPVIDQQDGLRNGVLAAAGVLILVLLIVVIGDRRRRKKQLASTIEDPAPEAPKADLEDETEGLIPRLPAP